MNFSGNILVVTTPSLEGIKIKKYIRPVSSHIVTGINIFGDFLGNISDTFGGRSNTYQKQLESIYNEAIDRLKKSASILGGNCIVGLQVDVNEISGKNKSMLMITAVGTVVEIEKEALSQVKQGNAIEKTDFVDVEKIIILKEKKYIREKAESGNLKLDDVTWDFITKYQMEEIYPFLVTKFSHKLLEIETTQNTMNDFKNRIINYLSALPNDKRIKLIYETIEKETNTKVFAWFTKIIEELHLFNYQKITHLINSDDFEIKKKGLKIAIYDQPYYGENDKQNLESLIKNIEATFKERGSRSMKKQLLSSKEKEIWICECSKSNDIESSYCSSCGKDIRGFIEGERNPSDVINALKQKIEFISFYLS